MSTKNPCNKCSDETLPCESLPSALDNFVQHFFGQVTKTLVNGKVAWTLPCDLESGIPGYPRATGEGLACWFKRLAQEVLLGQVEANGMTSSTVNFIQPAVGETVNVLVDNPVVAVPGSYAWSPDGGWYLVELVGGVSLTLRSLFPAPHNASAGVEVLAPTRFLFTGDLSRWDGEISTARQAAQAFATAADSAQTTSLRSYADGAAANAEGNAKAYADSLSVSTLSAANIYADSTVGAAQIAAQEFAENVADAAQAAAEAYADSVAAGIAPEGGRGIVVVGSNIHFAQSSSYQVGWIPFAASATEMGFIDALFWDPATQSVLFDRLDPGGQSQIVIKSDGAGALSFHVPDGDTAEVGLAVEHDGTDYVARSARASLLRQTASGFALAYDFGLTPGNTYAPTDRVIFDDDEILKVLSDAQVSGDLTVNGDANLEGHVVAHDSAALSSDPTDASILNSTLGSWQYRVAAASEGAGQSNRLHNRTEQVNGSGTDYTLTGTLALVDFGTTDPSISLPTAGTYQVRAEFSVLADAAGAGDVIEAKLRNSTDSTDVSQLVLSTCHTNSGYTQVTVQAVVTVTDAKTVQLWARNATSAQGTVVSTTTSISYSRMF